MRDLGAKVLVVLMGGALAVLTVLVVLGRVRGPGDPAPAAATATAPAAGAAPSALPEPPAPSPAVQDYGTARGDNFWPVQDLGTVEGGDWGGTLSFPFQTLQVRAQIASGVPVPGGTQPNTLHFWAGEDERTRDTIYCGFYPDVKDDGWRAAWCSSDLRGGPVLDAPYGREALPQKMWMTKIGPVLHVKLGTSVNALLRKGRVEP